MKRKLLLLFVIMSIMLFCLSVSAMDGAGTEAEPFLVKTSDDFVAIKNNLNAYYKLENDISVSSTTGAIVEGEFKGVFDGNGHKITVNIDAPTDQSGDTLDGLFGFVSGKIKNLTVDGSVKGSNKVAGIVGKLDNGGTVEGCVNYATIYGRKNVAGIAGVIFHNAKVINCINYGAISGKAINKGVDMGGIVGCTWYTEAGYVTVEGCYNAGKINGEGDNCGGIVGYSYAGKIINCFNVAEVASTSSSGVGGVVGKTENGRTHLISGYYSPIDGVIGNKSGSVTVEKPLIESTGVAIYLGSGSGIRGEFHLNKEVYSVFADLLGGKSEYGAVVSTKDIVEALNGDLISSEALSTGKVVFAPAMVDGEEQYSFVDASKGEGFHSYRFALTGFADTKQAYNKEFVILGYIKTTDANGKSHMLYVNTVKSQGLASSVEGTALNSVNILRVAEVTIADGDYKDNGEILSVLEHIVSLKEYNKKIEIDGVTDYGHANATFTSNISSGDTVVFKINNTQSKEFNDYIKELEANGYEKISENEINKNRFYVYKNGDTLINASYFVASDEVVLSKETVTALPDNFIQPSYEKKNNSSITQIQLADNVDIKEGMSYVIHLADGTFFIIDGGWCYDNYLEADKLYDTLVGLAGEGNEIVISGWLFTHCHGDHIGTFNYFVEKYHGSVTIKQLLYNFPPENEIAASGSAYMLNNTKQRYTYFKQVIAEYLTDTEIVKIHSGYKFYYANAEIEILQTFEDLYPSTVANYDFNSSSTIFTVKIEGQKMLFVGDVSDVGASRLNNMFKNALKSDFVQVAHHGLNSTGTIRQMYTYADASYVLYPAPNDWFRTNASNDANNYLQNISSTVKQIFVSGIQTVEIFLPYDGTLFDGKKIPMPYVKEEVDRPTQSVEVPDAYFDLDFSNGTVSDAKGNAEVTVVNGAIKETTVTHNGEEKTATAYTSGNNGTYYMSLKFDDITTDAQMGEFVLGSSTFEIFLKLDKLPGATVGLITSCNGGGVTLYLRKQAGGQINFQIGSTNPNSNVDGYGGKYSAAAPMNGTYPVIEAGKLLHIVGSYDSETNMMKIYINGILVSEADYGEGNFRDGSGNDTVLGIGYNPQYNGECLSSYANYELYEARIYNTALTDEQVAQEYWNCIDNLLTEAENE